MKHLIFDIGGVLVYPRLGEWNLPYRAAEILGTRARDIYTAAYIIAYNEAVTWLDESRIVKNTDDERILRRKFVEALDIRMGWHLTSLEVSQLTDDFTDNISRYGFFNDVMPWLPRWKKKYSLSVLSDAMPSILVYLRRYGVFDLLDAAVLSTQLGVVKPDTRMYQSVLEALNADAADCLFVDDLVQNLEGARQIGMQAIQMVRAEYTPAIIWDGPVVHNFSELNQFLETNQSI